MDVYRWNKSFGPFSHIIHKNQLKMNYKFKYKTWNCKPLRKKKKNIRKPLDDIGLGNEFMNMTPKTQATKTKINKWDYIKLEAQQKKPNSVEWEAYLQIIYL